MEPVPYIPRDRTEGCCLLGHESNKLKTQSTTHKGFGLVKCAWYNAGEIQIDSYCIPSLELQKRMVSKAEHRENNQSFGLLADMIRLG